MSPFLRNTLVLVALAVVAVLLLRFAAPLLSVPEPGAEPPAATTPAN